MPNEYQSNSGKVAQKGFTLVEMLAAFVLIGLMAAVILPNMQRWFDSLFGQAEKTQIAQQVQQLITRSALLGQDFELNSETAKFKLSDGLAALSLPAGWRIAQDQTLQVNRQAWCATTSLAFEQWQESQKRQTIWIEVDGKSCEARLQRSNS